MKLVFYVALGIILAGILKTSAGAVILPFLSAYILARVFRPMGVKLSKMCRISEKLGCAVLALILCFAAVYTVLIVSADLVDKLSNLSFGETLPEDILLGDDAFEKVSAVDDVEVSLIEIQVDGILDTVMNKISSIPGLGELAVKFFGGHKYPDGSHSVASEALSKFLSEALAYVGSAVASFVGKAAKALPSSILSLTVGAVSFCYLMADMDGIGEGIIALIPEKYRERVVRVFRGGNEAVFGCVRAYLELGMVVFALLFVGFLIAGIKGAVTKAVLIAILDALPVFGCGVVLIPWAIWLFIKKETGRGIALIVIYAVTWLVRQLLEPRLIGKSSGINPFVTLAVMYIGLRLSGVTGMLLSVIAVMTWKSVNEKCE